MKDDIKIIKENEFDENYYLINFIYYDEHVLVINDNKKLIYSINKSASRPKNNSKRSSKSKLKNNSKSKIKYNSKRNSKNKIKYNLKRNSKRKSKRQFKK